MRFEGCSLTAYKCSGGVPTIGYGHTKGVHMGDTITQEQATDFLLSDVWDVEKCLLDLPIYKDLTGRQVDALVMLVFNIGFTAFKSSTLYKCLLKHANADTIKIQWQRWCYSKGVKLAGLQKRRKYEVTVFLTDYKTA